MSSSVVAPALFLCLLMLVAQAGRGVFYARELEAPALFELLHTLGLLWALGWWLKADSRRRGVRLPYCAGVFLVVAWPFLLPYHLLKTRGARGLLTVLSFVGIYLAAYVVGVVVYVVLAT